MKNLLQRFAILSKREQFAVLCCCVFLLTVSIWLILLKPAYSYYSEGVRSANEGVELIKWIEQNRSNFEQLSLFRSDSNGLENSETNLLQLVSQSADTQSIQANRIEPTFDGLVRSTYTGVEFPRFLNFIQALEANNVTIESLSVDHSTAPGFVNASLVVSD